LIGRLTVSSLTTAVIVTLALAATTMRVAHAADTRELIGKWQSRNIVIEFRPDGTFTARPRQRGRGATPGSWSLIDHEHMATWTDESKPRRVNKFLIRDRYLIITESGGRLHVHERVESDAKLN
jgi:hypothetical protein